MSDLAALLSRALDELNGCRDETALQAWYNRYLGTKGTVTLALKEIGKLPAAERPAFGQKANQVKKALEGAHQEAVVRDKERALERSLSEAALDVTLPGRQPLRGRLHPSTQTLRRIYAIFADLGFQVFRSPEVEDDETNFGLLNMPEHHPARDMWDTFHTTRPGVLLRTHTSPGQMHAMRHYYPHPIRVILPGMCYRYEAITPRSEIMFHQVEGLAVGETVKMTDLIGTVTAFAQRMFGANRKVRIRSSYFPFTEPSIEVDMDSDDPVLTKGTGWLEIMGAGMVHPVVLRNGGYDPERYSGFAFGMGVERIAILMHRMDDIRQFWKNDVRFLQQF
jgi:phenylalanyl-tRNA synthetase alpha chain